MKHPSTLPLSQVIAALALMAWCTFSLALPNVRINDVTVTEGVNANAVFTVSIDANPAANQNLSVRLATQNGTAVAGEDYTARSATLTFVSNGTRSQTFSVPILTDSLTEPSETFTVVLSNVVNGVIADGTGVGTIQANSGTTNRPPTCRIDTPSANVSIRTGQTVNYSGTVTDPDGNPVTIAWSFAGGTPATSAVEDPGPVAYNAPGTFTTRLNASDGRGGTCTQQTRTITVASTPTVSINSTSDDSRSPIVSVVPVRPKVSSSTYSVLAVNDLGMHCADLDARVVNILPPYQVMLTQVVQKAATPILNPTGVTLAYSAVSSPVDPILSQSSVFNGVKADGSTFKSNFADIIPSGAYDAFYPGALPLLSTRQPPVTPDRGLPVPNTEKLIIGADGIVGNGDETVALAQQTMPGLAGPYLLNDPQPVQERYQNKPFFPNLPFGYIANGVNLHEATGIPFSPFDDLGRENPYPLVRVQAMTGSTVLATVDTVLPVSGETSCSNCHALPPDVPNPRSTLPTDDLSAAGLPIATSLNDPDPNLPRRVSVEYAADINILRLHDLKHGARYVNTSNAATPCDIKANSGNGTASCLTFRALVSKVPVVCQTCHYTPALDLAQVGPLSGVPGSNANGRNQLPHQSNSRVMHNHHGKFTSLFPVMPAPDQDPVTGAILNQAARQTALENSCYQCHPGKDTRCLRGAMFNGGVLCSDCHGSMQQIGNDFTRNVSTTNPGPAAYVLGKDFYTNAATPRVPWANEPTCGSCHTGDATSNLSLTSNVIANKFDSHGNKDGIRLRQAYRVGDAKATPIVPANKRFAEPLAAVSFNGFPNPGAGNPRLYRVSNGHGGVMCEGCHGPTHAEWPVANPSANDNLTATQLQGHVGPITECSACHVTSGLPGNTQGGPHGMHLVNDSRWLSAHEDLAEGQNRLAGRGTCGACHGSDHLGTVLSRVPVTRTFSVEGRTVTIPAGKPVACNLCHSLSESFGT